MSAKQELSKLITVENNIENINNANKVYDQLKNAAQLLYNQYLSEKVGWVIVKSTWTLTQVYVKHFRSDIPKQPLSNFQNFTGEWNNMVLLWVPYVPPATFRLPSRTATWIILLDRKLDSWRVPFMRL